MIELIIDYEDAEVFKIILEDFGYRYVEIPKMEDAWLLLIEPEQVTELEDALKQPPLRMGVIGSYNTDGTQYIWTKPQEIHRNHSINKYKNQLKGNPTEQEALNKQVLRVATEGKSPDRILTNPL